MFKLSDAKNRLERPSAISVVACAATACLRSRIANLKLSNDIGRLAKMGSPCDEMLRSRAAHSAKAPVKVYLGHITTPAPQHTRI